MTRFTVFGKFLIDLLTSCKSPICLAVAALMAFSSLVGAQNVSVTKQIHSEQRPRDVIEYGFNKLKREFWSNSKSYSMQMVEGQIGDRSGKALRMELRYGDCGRGKGGWDDCKNRNERVELAEYNLIREGKKESYGWKFFLPKSFSLNGSQEVIVGQFHQHSAQPAFVLTVERSGYTVRRRVNKSTGHEGDNRSVLIPKTSLYGKWHDIRVDAHWTKKADGYFQVLVDDRVMYQFKGSTLSESKAFFKLGLYRLKSTSAAKPISVFFDDLWRGRPKS